MHDYPNDWLCKCGHEFKDHGIPINDDWEEACLVVYPDYDPRIHESTYIDTCNQFRPMDNLTMIEHLAKEKDLIK